MALIKKSTTVLDSKIVNHGKASEIFEGFVSRFAPFKDGVRPVVTFLKRETNEIANVIVPESMADAVKSGKITISQLLALDVIEDEERDSAYFATPNNNNGGFEEHKESNTPIDARFLKAKASKEALDAIGG